jgi:hypothetical protein
LVRKPGGQCFCNYLNGAEKILKLQENPAPALVGKEREPPSIREQMLFRAPSKSDIAIADVFNQKYEERTEYFELNAEVLLASSMINPAFYWRLPLLS